MAFLNETEQWESGVYQLETTDPVQGGPDGVDNRPHAALANRTLWLKTQVESLAAQIVAGVDAATLQGKSVAQIQADIIAAISAGASSAYDTLIEIENAIESNDLDIASLLSTLSTKADRSELAQMGVNQVWTDETNNRQPGVIYTNTTGKPISVSIITKTEYNGFGEAMIEGVTMYTPRTGLGDSALFPPIMLIVPPNNTYSYSKPFVKWMELK